ncbi:hypothetical protein GGTG_00146 [Gaeumannomyces tritici R3-111a-1]|uniref:Uncharacterized protein n=1 Tax=Gaeumannomyces tritici (strain R3-111a-1) TaxID=644352 RepID=J3NFV2_GAET3|nr:hypothetical protein GGTG_00146 [Gaeumannomyces tritici R3-111a-1]EJT80142.1 hypothetical protein GGTG_00146 [Gaeumannomyces tritici R3-111a-1]
MTSKTWFLPPDFTFLPDGQIALGNVIPDPRRPTATLASLASHPTIVLPTAQSIAEKNRSFTVEKSRSFGPKLLALFLDFAGANGKTDLSRHKSQSFWRRGPRAGRFGPRHVYVISGLRLARQSFMATDEQEKKTKVDVGGFGACTCWHYALPTGGQFLEE